MRILITINVSTTYNIKNISEFNHVQKVLETL